MNSELKICYSSHDLNRELKVQLTFNIKKYRRELRKKLNADATKYFLKVQTVCDIYTVIPAHI